MTAREWAIVAAVAVAFGVHLAWKRREAKIENHSPPPPGGAPGSAGDQGKRTADGEAPRGDVNHAPGRTGLSDWIPPENPDIVQASRVGWHEDDPERPGCTHIHWVSRDAWEATQEVEVPRWRQWLGL